MGNSTLSLATSAHRVLRAADSINSSKADLEFPLVFQCENLNAGRDFSAITLEGNDYTIPQGRGHGISIGAIEDALCFRCEGNFSNMVLRHRNDDRLALEVNYRKLEVGTKLSLWYTSGHKEWACRFTLNSETRTISPVQSPHLVLGSGMNKQDIVLVRADDHYYRLQFVPDAQALFSDHLAEMVLQREVREESVQRQVDELCSPQRLKLLKQDGLLHFPQVVEKKLVIEALREVNKEIGAVNTSITEANPERLRGRFVVNKPAISNLFNESLLPLICQQLLGTKAPGKQGQGQVALRFPGDLCQSDTSHSSPAHFEALRKHWHIDGCASDAISGVTDHWGEIKNFDALVGVLLMDVIEPMSGELCYYPGSHYALGDYFKDHGLKDIYAKGSAGLPNGQCTDDLFLRPAEHCIGKAGDAFLANYLTAHFVAPNTSPYIRYAVYFRVRGVAFNDSTVPVQHVGESMLEPWINWPCMDTIVL